MFDASAGIALFTLAQTTGVARLYGDFMPSGTTGTQNIGDGTNYWNDISYKTLTDRGCLPWCDDGVELMDGRIVSDLEALCAIQKDPSKMTVHGLPMLDYKTFPKVSYKPEYGNGADGIEMTSVFGIMIGAFRQLSGSLREVNARLAELEKKVKS